MLWDVSVLCAGWALVKTLSCGRAPCSISCGAMGFAERCSAANSDDKMRESNKGVV